MNDVRHEHASREAEAWARFDTAVDRIPRDRWDEPGVLPGWGVKELLWHVAGWMDECIRQLDQMRDGTFEEREWPDEETDARNDELAQQARGMDADAVWAGLLESREAVRSRWNELPEVTDSAIELFADETYEHYDEHRADLERFAPP